MNPYITGSTIKQLRERKSLTQNQLAELLGITAKAVSKWETGNGLPDITLIQPLSLALGVSVPELMSGEVVQNQNLSSNLLRSKFYVCPLCGNILHATGGAVVSCCGIPLPPLEAEEIDADHLLTLEKVEDEYFVTVNHTMTKEHYISFIAHLTMDRLQLMKFYPEGNAETRFSLRGGGYLYLFCNKHGLMKHRLTR
ncbi:MAG: helix-turn-helix domain-containing protein [Clostridia bacterium]|nr:helix-turn-helix domain-containing protein [Clostridia bacterium]